MKDAAPFLTSLAAILAVILGPMIQIRVAKRQQISTVISNNRVRWIEEFRKEVAEFCALAHLYESQKRDLSDAEDGDDADLKRHYHKVADESFVRVNSLRNSLRMKLDISDRETAGIWNSIKKIDEMSFDRYNSFEDFEMYLEIEVENLRNKTRAMLRTQWRRVEKLE